MICRHSKTNLVLVRRLDSKSCQLWGSNSSQTLLLPTQPQSQNSQEQRLLKTMWTSSREEVAVTDHWYYILQHPALVLEDSDYCAFKFTLTKSHALIRAHKVKWYCWTVLQWSVFLINHEQWFVKDKTQGLCIWVCTQNCLKDCLALGSQLFTLRPRAQTGG